MRVYVCLCVFQVRCAAWSKFAVYVCVCVCVCVFLSKMCSVEYICCVFVKQGVQCGVNFVCV
jgi:hypothetical protein